MAVRSVRQTSGGVRYMVIRRLGSTVMVTRLHVRQKVFELPNGHRSGIRVVGQVEGVRQ